LAYLPIATAVCVYLAKVLREAWAATTRSQRYDPYGRVDTYRCPASSTSNGAPAPNRCTLELPDETCKAGRVTDIRIRPAQPEDHEAIVACVNTAYQGYIEDIGEKPAPMLDDYASLIRAEAVTVAIDGDDVAGLIVMWARPDHWYVDNVAVWPKRQGTGIGSVLLARAEEVARTAGFSEIRLYTNEAMTANTTYYEHRGYVETHRSFEAGYNRIYYSSDIS
jgi:GNAT superfamily N-acetyltransferase